MCCSVDDDDVQVEAEEMEDDDDETYVDHRLETYKLCCTSRSKKDHFLGKRKETLVLLNLLAPSNLSRETIRSLNRILRTIQITSQTE
jgi:hypothetical protein